MAGGKPRGAWADKAFRDALRQAVLEKDEETGHKKLRLLALKLITNGLGGDTTAIKEIADRLDGKPHQTQDVVVTDERSVIRAPEVNETADDWQATHKPH